MTPSTFNSRNPVSFLTFMAVTAVLVLAALAGRQPSLRLVFPVVAVAGVLLLVRQPGLGLAVLAGLSFTLPITFGTGTEVSLTAPVFLIPAVAAAWLVDGLRRRSLRLPASPTVLPLLLFAGSGLLSLVAGNAYWDPLVPRSGNLLLVQLGQWAIFALSALVFLLAADLGQSERWLRAAVWTFLAVGAIAVLEFYLPPLQRVLGFSAGKMANRSMFWAWLAAMAAGQLVFNRGLKPLPRLGLVALLTASAYVVWFRMNDWTSGWVPFTVAVVAVVWLRIWRRNRAAAAAVGAVLLALAAGLYPVLFEHAGGEVELQTSWGGRQVLYRAVFDVANAHPILGLGPAAYRHYAHTRWLSEGVGRAFYTRPNVSSHNNYIDIYAQTGLVGLGLFVWFLIAVGRGGWRLRSRFHDDFADGYVNGALGGLAGTVVAMMLADWFLPFVYNIGFPGFRTSALAWMFLGGLVALEQVSGGAQAQGSSGD